jgi:hypothetical protein
VSVTDQPSGVSTVTDFPLPGTVPTKLITPSAGARTDSAAAPPISMPRCCPAEYGCTGSNENGCSTGPSTGQVQASAGETAASATMSTGRIRPSGREKLMATSVV